MSDTETKPRPSAFMLMAQAPVHRGPRIDVETFKGLQSLDDVKAWMDALYAFDKPVGSIEDLPPIRTVTLCGSSRFLRQFVEWNAQLTRFGFVVFTLGIQSAGNLLTAPGPTEKAILDAVHFAKIRASDAIVVIDAKVDGKRYIGESTAREIAWAERLGKKVFYTGGLASQDYTKPDPEPWGAYGNDQLEDKARFLQRVLDGIYKRCPAAMLAESDGVYLVDIHDEYGWDKIDENAIAEEPETYPAGSRHVAYFSGDLGEAVLVIDRNDFDDALGRQAVRWHLEVLTDEERAARKAKFDAERAARTTEGGSV